jgi:hypothetical protein
MQTMQMPLATDLSVSIPMEIPELGELWMTPNGRWGIVNYLSSKFTKSGYVVVNVGFENVDPITLEPKTEWACISPMA